MRRLIESLIPADQRIYWKWVGTVFVFYVAVMAAALGMIASHDSRGSPSHQAAAAGKAGSLVEAPVVVGRVARSD
ncbi:hypothetical protein [Bradyrhizobium sp.]|uniref:hypothetical protein n=1 Tax=Bradyrhizobium sp. TaxID=376 RepID=UPI003C75EB1B